ncbi:hypothetical protein BpHYR1_007054, partial [Brachionus plicatilis]
MHWSTENEDNNDEDESVVEKPKVSRPRKKPKALELDHKKKIKSKKGTIRVSNRIDNDKKGSDAKDGKHKRGRPPSKKLVCLRNLRRKSVLLSTFYYIPVEDQIRRLFTKKILPIKASDTINANLIEDIYDGDFYKKLMPLF